ncbi:MAG: hypothetical protein AB1473_07545 [Thermodesulfobacteriota bacterium]
MQSAGYLFYSLDEEKYRKCAEWADKMHLGTLKDQLKREQGFGNESEVERYRTLVKKYEAEMKRKRHPRKPVD